MTKEKLRDEMVNLYGVCELSDEQLEYCVNVSPIDNATEVLIRVRQKFSGDYCYQDLLSDAKKIKENPDDYSN